MSWRHERFLLREDDLILGSMMLGFEITLSRKWPAFDVTLAQVRGDGGDGAG